MKVTVYISIFFILGYSFLNGQTSFSCTFRQYCYWNDNIKIYQNCKGYEENSIFVVSKDENSFTHVIENMKTTFTVKQRQYDKETDIWTYHASTAEGNKYTYIFDPRNKEIRFVPDKDEKTVMQLFTISSIF